MIETQHDSATMRSGEPLTSWRPGQPIPRPVVMPGEVEDVREIPPEGLTVEDVEIIWWSAAAALSYEVLRKHLEEVIKEGYDPSGFNFFPIADLEDNGRYPSAVIALLREILPRGALIVVDPEFLEGTEEQCLVAGCMVIEREIWHLMTLRTIPLVPADGLPEHLRDLKFCADLGL